MSSQQPQAIKHTHIGRREFIKAAGAAAGITYIQGCATPPGGRSAVGEDYSVAILGDTHYDAEPEQGLSKGRVDDLRAEVEFFRPGVREYFFGNGAGHYRLDVSGGNVALFFYPGDARAPARRFDFFPIFHLKFACRYGKISDSKFFK